MKKMEGTTNKMTPRWTLMIFLALIFLNVLLLVYFKAPSLAKIPQVSTVICQESLTDKIGHLFHSIMTEDEKNSFRNTLAAFKDAVRSNVTYFMYAGTLLGSYRHHGFIPWDIDIDLIVKQKDRGVLKKCLQSLTPEYILLTKLDKIWRFYRNDSLRTTAGFGWLHVDIFFFEENTTQLWDIDNIRMKYNQKDVFPLTERPFMGMMLPAPKNTPLVLSKMFNINMCRTNMYASKNEKKSKRKYVVEIPCDLLKDRLPFVNREQAFNKTHLCETLQILTDQEHPVNITTYIIPK